MTLVIATLAAYRLTVLVTSDSITDPLREWVARDQPGGFWDTLINCPWCIGFWVSAGVTLLLALTGAVALPVVVWLLLPFAMSAVTGIVEEWRLSS